MLLGSLSWDTVCYFVPLLRRDAQLAVENGGRRAEAAPQAPAAAATAAAVQPAIVTQGLPSDASSTSSEAQSRPRSSSESEYESAEEPVDDIFASPSAAAPAPSEPLLLLPGPVTEPRPLASDPVVSTQPIPAEVSVQEPLALGVVASTAAGETTASLNSETTANVLFTVLEASAVPGETEKSACEGVERPKSPVKPVVDVPLHNNLVRLGFVSGGFSESQDDSEFELYEQELLSQIHQNEGQVQPLGLSVPGQDIADIQNLALSQELALSQDIAINQELSLFQDSLPISVSSINNSTDTKSGVPSLISKNESQLHDAPISVNQPSNQLSSELDQLLKCADVTDSVDEALQTPSSAQLVPTDSAISNSHGLEPKSNNLKSPDKCLVNISVHAKDNPDGEISECDTVVRAKAPLKSSETQENAPFTPPEVVAPVENSSTPTAGGVLLSDLDDSRPPCAADSGVVIPSAGVGAQEATLTLAADSRVSPADTPVASTDAPAVPADAPAVPADAPAVPADAPAVPADAPAVPADAPAVPADAPAVPADTSQVTFPEEEIPIVPKATYNLDFLDHLDDPNFNPFGTKASIRNSPPPSPPPGVKLPPLKPAVVRKKKVAGSKAASAPSPPPPALPSSSDKLEPGKAEDKGNSSAVGGDAGNHSEQKVITDNRLDNSATIKDSVNTSQENLGSTLPETPKRVAKKPVLKSRQKPSSNAKSVVTKPKGSAPGLPNVSVATPVVDKFEKQTKGDGNGPNTEDEVIVPSKGYNLDFLDNLDDPNFNPFASKSSFGSSSPSSKTELNNTSQVVEKNNNNLNENKDNDALSREGVLKSSEPTNLISNLEGEPTQCNEAPLTSEKSNSSLKPETSSKLPSKAHVSEVDTVPSENLPGVSKPAELDSQLKLSSQPDPQSSAASPLTKPASGLNRVPSFGGISISLLESQEFDQLLGNEASRLAEELSTLSLETSFSSDAAGVVDEGCSDMASSRYGRAPPARRSLNLEGGNEAAFKAGMQLSRSPPSAGLRRPVSVGAAADPFVPSRTLRRDDDDVGPTSSLDSGLSASMQVSGGEDSRGCGEVDNHSEAGPDIATGMTPSDLQAASQLDELELVAVDHLGDEDFLYPSKVFKDAKELEHQLRRTFGPGILGSSKGLDCGNGSSDKDKVCGVMAPPREERSAPEGTSSPTPRPQEASSDKGGYLTQAQVDALLKRQEAQFEERLQRMSQCTSEKEQDLHVKMKEEQKELAELRSAVVEVTQSREALLKMLEQYKEMLAAVVKGKTTLDKEQEQKMKDLEAQKNQALEDLANVEAAFSDVHRKYERTKQVVETLRRNEETLRGAVADYEGKLKRQEATLVTFQQHAEDKMQQASDEYDKLKKNTDQELTKMGALLKKAEMKIISLQEQLDRKSRDNQELTTLLDDLIAKMGPSK